MNTPPVSVLEALRTAAAYPSWAQANYAIEKIHTNSLVTALNKGERSKAKTLAAALWSLADGDAVDPERITKVTATPELLLKRGRHGTVDLVVDLAIGGSQRRLAIEVKVDSVVRQEQLASMHAALGEGTDRRLVLLCLGATQVYRVEPNSSTPTAIKRWSIAHVLGLRDLIVAAAPIRPDAEAWLAEVEREDNRRMCAWQDEDALTGCGYRDRLVTAYRYGEVTKELAASGSEWEVSLQPFGVVLHGKSSHWEIRGTSVTLYLEVADGALRVKAGAWHDNSDALAAAEPRRSQIAEAFTSRGFEVKMAKRTPGSSVTLMVIDPGARAWPREAFVDRLRRASDAWAELVRGRPAPGS